MKNLLAGVVLVFAIGVQAQKAKPQFTSLVQGGLLEGEQGSAFQLKAINGVKYKNWIGGIGVALDYYQSRSVPLFLAVRHFFEPTTKGVFLYADGGYNFPWQTAEQKSWDYQEASGGFYGDGGLGYQFPLRNKSFLFLSAGYSQKAYSGKYAYATVLDIYPSPYPTQTYKIDYTLRRVSLQLGLRF